MGEVVDLYTEEMQDTDGKAIPKITGVRLNTGTIYHCKAVIICTGTYLNARCLVGETITETGPGGMRRARDSWNPYKTLQNRYARQN